MKNSLLIAISLSFGSFLMAQNTNETTTQKAAANLPYSYGFETADLDEWFVTNEGSGNIWVKTQASGSTPSASEGTFYMMYEYHNTDPANTYLYSRGLNLQAGKNLTLQFDY